MDINVKLDINKAGQFINEPVTMRAGESDNVIKASIFKDGTPYTGFKTATFNTTRSSGSVIANDPATVSGNTVSYSVAPSVTSSVGKLRNSYFLLNGKTSTESFEVAILPGVSADGDITDYVPGLSGLQDKWTKVSTDWDMKIDGIKKEIENVSISDELKTAMNAAIDEAKAEYMATFNEAVKSIDDTAKSLQDKQTAAASELDKTIADAKAKGDSAADSVDSNIKSLNDKSKDIDTAVSAVNSKIADVNSFLANVQTSITAANSKFTSDQETSVKAVLDELKAEVANTKTDADSLAKQISDIKTAVDDFDMPQVTADTKEALETAKSANSKIDDLQQTATEVSSTLTTVQTQVTNSAVGTNLLTDSNFSSGLDHWRANKGDNADCKLVVTTDSDGDTCVHITGTGGSSGIWQTTVKFGQNQITTGSVLAKGIGKLSRAGFASSKNSNFGTVSTESYSKIGTTSQTVSDTNAFCIYFNPVNGVVDVYIKFPKLEKGPTATDYSLNPLDISTDGSVQTSIKNALGNYSTTAEVDSKISTGVGQAKTYAEQSIKDIIGAAPDTLDTIAELADAVTKNKDGVQAINDGITKKADKIEPGTVLYDSKWHWDYTQKKVVFDSESGTKTPDVSNVRNGIYLGLADNTALNKQDVYQYALLSANFAQSKNFYCQTNAVGDDPAEDKNVWIKIPKLDLLYSNDLETHLNKASNEKYINNEIGAFSTISLMLFFRPIGMTNSLVGDTPNSTEQYTDPGPFLESPKQMCLSLSRSENNKIGSFSSPQFGIPIPNDTAGKTVVLNTPVITQIIAY